MKVLLGPMLYARDQVDAGVWSFFVNLYLGDSDAGRPPALRLRFFGADGVELAGVASAVATPVADFSGLRAPVAGVLWRWTVQLPRGAEAHRVTYRFEPVDGAKVEGLPDDAPRVVVPATGGLPRVAFFSCNGASDAKTWNSVMRMKRPFGCWADMKAQHEVEDGGFHLLLGGGDQVYADSLMDHEPLLEFRKRELEHKLDPARPPPQGFHEEMLARYVELYCERWSGEVGIAPMLARVPGLFTWDDHDIFDGWGSHESLQACAWFAALYSAAALAFEAFQLGELKTPVKTPALRPPCERHYFQTLRFVGTECDVDVVALDLRSGRTYREQPGGKMAHEVMSKAQWATLDAWRQEHAARPESGTKARHVLLLSSVPLVHLRYGPGAEVMGADTELHDDMLDQWESVVHRGERTRLMVDLFTLAQASCCAVTVVSGDVHVGARGLIRSRNPEHIPAGLAEAAIEQVTSSGIVHPPPSTLQFLGMRMLAEEAVEDLPSFMQTEMLPVGSQRYLRERNWLTMRVEPARTRLSRPKLWLRWEAEHTALSMQVVVEPPPLMRGTGV
ncbi:alkaline phosphatase D family protein [Myxococcus stipitatus]|uniref:alkaline phosphatase D family protein n=1 Tax=Myxococcus stipitatus TaxID=83455 RepID=UPI001F3A1EEA|nr:alkaline phosphatase D family protein [Myxococcus stipitatus]MCE9668455.1 alkaline phosphatase D family protein [Myxococcus stipitatus]